jgi:hypothetical protein
MPCAGPAVKLQHRPCTAHEKGAENERPLGYSTVSTFGAALICCVQTESHKVPKDQKKQDVIFHSFILSDNRYFCKSSGCYFGNAMI